jgi:hypothetical protein
MRVGSRDLVFLVGVKKKKVNPNEMKDKIK